MKLEPTNSMEVSPSDARLRSFMRLLTRGISTLCTHVKISSLFKFLGERAPLTWNRKSLVPVRSLPVVLDEYRKGIQMRNWCLELVSAIELILEDNFDTVHESQKERVSIIREALVRLSIPTTKYFTDELSGVSVIKKNSDPTFSQLIGDVQRWTHELRDASDLLVRVHRYISNVKFKMSARRSDPLGQGSVHRNSHSDRALNLEILAYEALLGETVVSSTPTNIQIEPTGRCNARCKPCPLHSPVGRIHPDLAPKTISKIPHVLSAAQFVELFALGEPTIAPSFEDIASLCHSQGCETHTITNGTRLLESAALRKMKKIGISFDGDTKETFEAIRTGIDFDSLIEAIRVFRRENPEIFLYLNCTVNRANLLQIPAIATRARNLELQAVCFHRMFEVEPEIDSASLKSEDISIYREKVEEAKRLLEGSNVLLFDYAILDRADSSSEPLDPERSLTTIKSFVPKKDTTSFAIGEIIEKLSTFSIPLYPENTQLVISSLDRNRKVDNSLKDSATMQSMLPENLHGTPRQFSEKRAAALRERVREVGANGLKLPYCTAAWARLIVKADGRMFPCSCWGRTYANLNQVNSFEETWNGEFHQKLRASFHGNGPMFDRCKTCPSIDRYQGFTEILQVVKRLGINYDDLPKQDGCNPPPGKLQL